MDHVDLGAVILLRVPIWCGDRRRRLSEITGHGGNPVRFVCRPFV
jgi:hypothetical protein